jgi:hypothetical protein
MIFFNLQMNIYQEYSWINIYWKDFCDSYYPICTQINTMGRLGLWHF